ncbi:hypothetical protein TNCV_1007781 [Trichonephila clavipes]|nr:hypothetical protein TNCV_1007781 [Trichonephila clavipes]
MEKLSRLPLHICVVTNATRSRVTSDQGSQNSSRQRTTFTPVIRRSFEHHAGDRAIWLGSALILKKHPWGVVRGPHLSFPSTNLTRGLAARWLFRVSPCHKDTIHLQTSMTSSGFEPRFNGKAVIVTNHYTEIISKGIIKKLLSILSDTGKGIEGARGNLLYKPGVNIKSIAIDRWTTKTIRGTTFTKT